MKKMSEKVVFFGSGPVAAQALALLSQHVEIEAVITKPKPAHHRDDFPVLDEAEKRGQKLLTVTDKRSLSELFASRPVKSQIGIVIDFGIIIAQDVIDYFPFGIVNSHFSLLPHWRGADPISFAILEGDKKTGVSLMVIDAGLDTGKLITQKGLEIGVNETTVSLTKKLIELSNLLLIEYLPKYIMGDIKPHNQPHPDRATYSRKLTKEDGRIDWQKPARVLEREIRAFQGWPKSYAALASVDVIISAAKVVAGSGKPSTLAANPKQLVIYCGQQALEIEKLKPRGKNEMSGLGFMNGYVH